MSKCILCFGEHNMLWCGEPNMYCKKCSVVRETARNVADQIIGNVYLGDMLAAGKFEGTRICVHEMGATYKGLHHQISILSQRPISKHDRTGAIACVEQLDKAALLIESLVQHGEKPVLVHCFGGIERSPLTLAWWLLKSGRVDNIDSAYELLKARRPAVSPRLFWLPRDHELFREIT